MQRPIIVTYRTWNIGRTTKVFTDWFDFADWLKQMNEQKHVVSIYEWKYQDNRPSLEPT